MFHERNVHQFVLNDPVRHSEHERPIGAWTNGHIHIGMHGRGGKLGVNGDELCAFFSRLANELPIMNIRLGWVAAPRHDDFSIYDIGGIVSAHTQQ